MTDNNNQVIDTLQNDIELLIESYIDTLNNPDDIYNNKGAINGLLKYLYNNYIGDLLNNKTLRGANRYDIKVLNKLWEIYTSIIYKYQLVNPRISIEQYCSMFVNISRETIYKYNSGDNRDDVTHEYMDTVKKWRTECQAVLMADDSVKSIFLLKACHGLSDNITPVETIEQIRTEQLPNLGLHNAITGDNNVVDLPVKSLET